MADLDFKKLEAKFIDVSPNIAEEFLKRNTANRNLRKRWYETLLREINNGTYQVTHQGVAFNKSGVLVDGQHRLQAIKESGKTIKLLVTTGLEDDVFKNIDRGMKRTIADVTHLNAKTAEVCKLIGTLCSKDQRSMISTEEVLDVANSGVADLHEELIAYCNTVAKYFTTAPSRAIAIVMILDGHDKDYIFDTYKQMAMMDLEKMPLIATSIVKRLAQGKIYSGGAEAQKEVMAIFKKVYDYKNRNLLLRINNSDISLTVQYVKNVMKKLIKKDK